MREETVYTVRIPTMMFNEKAVENFEGAALRARRFPLGDTVVVGFDCANLLQEWADRLRKEDHEFNHIELAEMCGQYKGMLVFE